MRRLLSYLRGRLLGTPREELLTVYAVIYSNYEPSNVDSLWSTQEKAEARAYEVGMGWRVTPWNVG